MEEPCSFHKLLGRETFLVIHQNAFRVDALLLCEAHTPYVYTGHPLHLLRAGVSYSCHGLGPANFLCSCSYTIPLLASQLISYLFATETLTRACARLSSLSSIRSEARAYMLRIHYIPFCLLGCIVTRLVSMHHS